MSHWQKAELYRGEVEGIELPGVLAILKEGSSVDFVEMCDEVNEIRFTKAEALQVLREAIAYIEGNH